MNQARQQFFALLRAGLWNTPVEAELFSGRTDWEAIFAFSARQTVSGIVAEAASKLPADLLPPALILNKMRTILATTFRMHALFNRTLVGIVTMFRQKGIRVVLLKGQGVALNYDIPTLRHCGDIDLYIGERAYNSACTLAREWHGEDAEAVENDKHYSFQYGGVTIELHHVAEWLPLPWHNVLFQRWTAQQLQDDNLRCVGIDGTEIALPPVSFDALYIFNHVWHHFLLGGIGLRQLCDWVRFLHTFADQIDRVTLQHDLKAFGLWRAWQTLGYIAVNTLGLPAEEFPFYTDRYAHQAAWIIEKIETGGNFGFFNPLRAGHPESYLAGKMHTLRRVHAHFGQLFTFYPLDTIALWSQYIRVALWKMITEKLGKN